MKAFYDKLLFILALLALGAGVGFYFMKTGAVHNASGLLQQQPSGSAYKAIEAPEIRVEQPVWNDPVAQDTKGLERYDIFTPPVIYWDKDKKEFIYELPEEPEPPQPFGLKLVSINREMFRVQLEAYFEGPSGQPEDAIWQFYNSERGESVRGHIGETFKDQGFKLKSGKVEKVITEDEGSTTISKVPTVVIVDIEDDNREVTLRAGNKLYIEGKLKIVMATANPFPAAEFTWEEAGQTYETGDTTFTLKEINFDNQSVTVEKTAPDLEEPEVETLSPQQNTPQIIPSEPSTESEESNMDSGFESLFN